ncbi:SRPBCC domain-containing protein [Halosolutus gelatinilyticus]|uniref:SRPBCC domain-containing protein n=1 Tax=Halosolutus gelatinilyticus TaxID=2931975 RepID=UPI001FF6147F|nr:SRPBCC domain-containing protein [Halosolutus gelatinilyticus]
MTELVASISIDAPPAVVWSVLSDFDAYPSWNPFIPTIEGDAITGTRLRVRIEPPDSRAATLRPRVLEATPGRRLVWLGRLGLPGLFDGKHAFELEALPDDRTRFTQRETFHGLLVGLLLDESNVRRGFEAMNEAIKTRAEARVVA